MNMYSSDTAFIERISAEALASNAVNHPYLDALREGELPNMELALKDFAFQYGLYSSKFIRYLSAVIKNLSDTHHKEILLSNLTEEQGEAHDVELPADVMASIAGVPHTQLYHRFQEALGVDANYRSTTPQSQTGVLWSKQFLQLCEMDECVGVGAIGLGTEFIISSVYHQILEGLKAHSRLTMSQRVFFDLHSQCDDEHAAQIISIAKALALDNVACEKIEYGMRMAINMRIIFWDKMLERALNFPASVSIERLAVV